jgi:hypothetical protein
MVRSSAWADLPAVATRRRRVAKKYSKAGERPRPCHEARILQTTEPKTVVRWIAMMACVIWIGITFYQQFLSVDPDQFSFRSADVESQMKTCGGSFQQRYECKEAIIIDKGHDSFLIWAEKGCLILVPPLIVAFLLNRGTTPRRRGNLKSRLVRLPPSVAKRRVR